VAALFALTRVPSQDVVAHLSRALDDEDWEIRIYAAEALKARGHAVP
jgi:HEAT repeat protein